MVIAIKLLRLKTNSFVVKEQRQYNQNNQLVGQNLLCNHRDAIKTVQLLSNIGKACDRCKTIDSFDVINQKKAQCVVVITQNKIRKQRKRRRSHQQRKEVRTDNVQ